MALRPCFASLGRVFRKAMNEFFDITDNDRLPGRFDAGFRSALSRG